MDKLTDNKLWQDANKEMKSYNPSRFHWNKLRWITRIWFIILFKVVEKRLNKLEEELKERIII